MEKVSLSAMTFLMFEFSRSTNEADGMLANTGVGALAAPPEETASSTSALMILPPGPVPYRPARFTPLALAMFWARGLAKSLSPEALAGAAGDD